MQLINNNLFNYQNFEQFQNDFISIISEVAKGIFSAGTFYVKENLHFLIFQGMFIVQPNLINLLVREDWFYFALPSLGLFLAGDDPSKVQLLQCAALTAIVAYLSFNAIPLSLTAHLAFRGFIYGSSLLSNGHSIYKGVTQLHKTWTDSTLNTAEKTRLYVCGFFTLGGGLLGLNTTFTNTLNLYKGVQRFKLLDPTQQEFVLKFNALESLSTVKEQNAVIINGLNPAWSQPGYQDVDALPDGSSVIIYQNYNARTYEVSSPDQLNQVLSKAANELGGKIDLISFQGHANNQSLTLNSNYHFTGNPQERQAIKKVISDSGQIILAGCETALPNKKGMSLTKKLSQFFPQISITGYNQILWNDKMWASMQEKKLHVMAWNELSENITALYLNGKRVPSLSVK